jgi:hypothetical protein
MEMIGNLSTNPQEARSPQQQRRTVLQAAKEHVINHYWTSLGEVTSAMRGVAKGAIERELATLPLEELPFEEVCELAAAIRDQCYGPVFQSQAREAEHQRIEQETRRQRELEQLGVWRRADRRKTAFLDQAIGQAGALCEAKQLVGWDRLSVLGDIKSRLNEFLTGEEPVADAHTIIETVLHGRFAEADAKLAAKRVKDEQQWREELAGCLALGALAGLVVLALTYPAQALPILNWLQRLFGLAPDVDAGSPQPDTSEATQSAASTDAPPHSKRRRKTPVSPVSPPPVWRDAVAPGGHA